MGGLSQYVYPMTNVPPSGGAGSGAASNITPIAANFNASGQQAFSAGGSLTGNPVLWIIVTGIVVMFVLHTI